jgi:opacity protein-like surface antigen
MKERWVGMKVGRICVVAVVLVAIVSLAHGAGIYVGGYGAYSFGGDVKNESLGYGINLGLPLGEQLGIELSGTLLEDDSAIIAAKDFDLGSIDLSLLYRFPICDDKVDLYIGVGASYNRFSFNSDTARNIKDDDQIGFLGEAGIALFPVNWLRIFADIRYNIMTYTVDNNDLDQVDEDYNFFVVRVGAGLAL